MDGRDHLCPSYHRAADLLGKRWTAHILKALLAGPQRFSAVAVGIPGLSDRLLSQRLKELEIAGVVTRQVYPATPVRVEYALTAKGRDLAPVVTALQRWAEIWETQVLTKPGRNDSPRRLI